jgi:hypothetical protein
MLDESYVEDCVRRARCYQGAWTGSAGSVAADSMRLVMERRELLETIDKLNDENAALRRAVESRQAPRPAAVQEGPVPVSGPDPDMLLAAWEAVKRRTSPAVIARQSYGGSVSRLIGITGPAGAGKTLVASMVPGALVMQFADPLYAMLAVITGLPENVLRHPAVKSRPIEWLGKTSRELLQTLGTEWGRETVARDIWVHIGMDRAQAAFDAGIPTIVFADVRFENEAQEIRRRGGAIWHVARPGVGRDGHSSEAGIEIAPGDSVIENSSTPAALRELVERLWGPGEQAYNGE